LKIKIIKIRKNHEKKFKDNCKVLIQNNIALKSEILSVYLRSLKNFSTKNYIFLQANYENKNSGILICNLDYNTGLATIIWVIVNGSLRKKKIGKTLIKKLLEILKKKNKIHKVRVFSYKKEINSFYLSLNFKIEGVYRKHWFKNNFWSFGKLLKK
jgi:GNAT superfamily N-acetyltransferase